MKRFISLLLVLAFSVCLFSACRNENPNEEKEPEVNYGLVLYVSPDGNDANEGTKSSPLATINGAVGKIADIKASSGLPEGGIKVEFASGRYRITETIEFTAENSGEDGQPVVFAEAEGSTVIFDGGVKLNNEDFKPVTDEAFLSLLPTDEARKNVLCIDLSKYDMGDFLALPEDFDMHYFKQELSANGKVQTVARWPNGKEFATADISDNSGEFAYFNITDDQASRWSKSPTLGWFGYGQYDWQCSYIHDGVGVDTEKNCFIMPNNRVNYAPCGNGMPFYIYNTPCELDAPGEYYRDYDGKVLYYWPVEALDSLDLAIGSLSVPAFNLNGGKNLTFEGMDFQNFPKGIFRGTADGLYIYNSVFSSCYEQAIFIEGFDITIDGCEMFDIAAGGIRIVSGPGTTEHIGSLTGDISEQKVGRAIITNNILHDTSRFELNHHAPLKIGGWGAYIAHNVFYDAPHHAIEDAGLVGNSVIEYNEFYHVSYMAVDSAAIHIGRNWGNRKFTVQYNYFHDIYCDMFDGEPAAVYFDDCSAGDDCHSNIIVNIGGNGIQLCGGRYLFAYNNVLANINGCGIVMDGRGFGWGRNIFSFETAETCGYVWKLVLDSYQTVLWRYCMPEILCAHESDIYFESDDTRHYYMPHGMDCAGTPAYCRIFNNIGYNLNIDSRHEIGINLGLNTELFTADHYEPGHQFDEYEQYTIDGVCNINGWGYQFNEIQNNVLYSRDTESIFADPENGNFFLKDDSKVYRDVIGFEKWDYSLVGLQK